MLENLHSDKLYLLKWFSKQILLTKLYFIFTTKSFLLVSTIEYLKTRVRKNDVTNGKQLRGKEAAWVMRWQSRGWAPLRNSLWLERRAGGGEVGWRSFSSSWVFCFWPHSIKGEKIGIWKGIYSTYHHLAVCSFSKTFSRYLHYFIYRLLIHALTRAANNSYATSSVSFPLHLISPLCSHQITRISRPGSFRLRFIVLNSAVTLD